MGERVAAALDRPARDPEVERTTDGLLALLGHDVAPNGDPATVRQDAGRALTVYVDHLTSRQPLVLELSDLHWADDAVLALVDDLFATLGHRPVVVLATARPALLDRWTPRPGRHNTMIVHVEALGRAAAQDLLEHLVGEAVEPQVAELLIDRSGGNPFFLEELVNLLDGAAGASVVADGAEGLPDTLRGLVAARLDDLGPMARAVLQNASVIGQRGPIDGLREMGRQMARGADVDGGLAELVDEEIMEVGEDQWSFRSDLVREVAYQTITKADRAKCHLGIAHHLEAELGVRHPRPAWLVDQLAHHYGTAVALAEELGPVGRTASFPPDLSERARRWVVEAAERARRDQAMPTAVRLYGQALGLLGDEPGPRVPAELHLARADVATEAWNVPVAREELALAIAAAEAAPFPDLAAKALVVRGRIEQREGEVDLAVATLAEAADRYEALGDDRGRADSLRQRGMVEIFGGRIEAAERSARAALAAFEEVGDHGGRAWALQNLAWIAFTTSRLEEASDRAEAALETFAELVDGRGMAWSLGLLAWIRFQQRRVAEAAALGEQVLEEARNRNDPWAVGMMTLLLAGLRLWSGRTAEAVELAAEGKRRFEGLGDTYGLGQASAVLGRALVMSGRVDEGLALLAAAAGSGSTTGDGSRIARLTWAATAVQLGQPDLVPDDELLGDVTDFGREDGRVLLGLQALQRGDRAGAAEHLRPDEPTDDPNLLAALALLATGSGDASALADRVEAIEEATYFDRAMAAIAAALQASARDGDDDAAEACRRVVVACEQVDGTGDKVARAVVGLLAAAVAARLGGADAVDLEAAATERLDALGIAADGWRRLIELTATPNRSRSWSDHPGEPNLSTSAAHMRLT